MHEAICFHHIWKEFGFCFADVPEELLNIRKKNTRKVKPENMRWDCGMWMHEVIGVFLDEFAFTVSWFGPRVIVSEEMLNIRKKNIRKVKPANMRGIVDA